MSSQKDKFPLKQQQLVDRTAIALNISTDEARQLLSIGRKQSVRLNTLRADATTFTRWQRENNLLLPAFTWMKEGYKLNDEQVITLRDSSLNNDGALYIQNAASWLPVLALNPQPGESVLDVCAAPGGKTSHIAAHSHNQAFITANDNSKARLHKLQANTARLGVENIEYSLHDATRLSFKMPDMQFDKILLDAPCSGEGMMTLDNRKDFESWSVAHIKRLQQLQKKLIIQAWALLKPGGTLVYSTCTMAPEENEAVVDYLLRRNDDAELAELPGFMQELENRSPAVLSWNNKPYNEALRATLRLKPSADIEAFYVAKLTKKQPL